MTMRYDRIEVKAKKTDDGFIHDSAVITRTGIFEYRDTAGKIRREYRPPEAVFHLDSLNAYKGLPITNGHPGRVTGRNAKGKVCGSILTMGRQDGDDLVTDLVIHDTSPVDEGKKELSVGYEVEFDETPGVLPSGERYDAIQIKITPNHLALVKKGRAGTARLNLDAAEADLPEDEPTMTMVKVKLASGLSYDAAPEVEQELNTLRTQLAGQTKDLDKATARADSAEAKVKDFNEDDIRKKVKAEIENRLKLETAAAERKVSFKADSTDRDIQEAVIHSVRGADFKMDGKSDEYVAAAFDLALTEQPTRKTTVAENRKQMNQDSGDDKNESTSASSAREKYRESLKG